MTYSVWMVLTLFNRYAPVKLKISGSYFQHSCRAYTLNSSTGNLLESKLEPPPVVPGLLSEAFLCYFLLRFVHQSLGQNKFCLIRAVVFFCNLLIKSLYDINITLNVLECLPIVFRINCLALLYSDIEGPVGIDVPLGQLLENSLRLCRGLEIYFMYSLNPTGTVLLITVLWLWFCSWK